MPTLGLPELEQTTTGLVTVDGRTFPLKATRVQGRAQGGLATTRLVQEYDNPHTEPLEVIYTLPLPADGAVVSYTIRLGDKVITGHVEPRETARKQYRQALEEGRTAGLLEQERADTFTQTLGSLPPGIPARVEVEVLHPLGLRSGVGDEGPLWEYRFPTVVGVRYNGEPGRVSDSEELDVARADETGTPVRLALELVLADGTPELLSPRSPSHTLDRRDDDGATHMTLADKSRLDRDIVVRWRASRPSVGLSLVEGPGTHDDDGRYGLLTVTPPAVPATAFARDLTILIDASGSMHGEPLAQAKRVVEELLGSLANEDRFEVLAFANRVVPLTDGLVPARAAKVKKAIKRLHDLHAGGGTEMTKALLGALKPLRPDSQRQVVLLTDGYVGFEQQVISQVLKDLPAGARLHVVGIGSAPNRTLTRGASRAGGGVELIVGSGDDASEASERLRRHTAAPVLTEITVRGSAVLHVAPERPRDVLAGNPALLALMMRPEGGTIEVKGVLAGQSEPWIARIEVETRAATEDEPEGERQAAAHLPLPLGAFYGRERVEDCEMKLAAAGRGIKQDSILDEIERLGVQHQIVTRRTSLVAVSEDVTVDPGDPRRRQRLAVELPAEVSAEGVGLMAGRQFLTTIPGAALHAQVMKVSEEVEFLQAGEPAFEERPTPLSRTEFQAAREIVEGTGEIDGRIVRREPDLLVVELEVPERGLRIPGDDSCFLIELESGEIVMAELDESLSTKPGPHEPGLTVRLGLRLEGADGTEIDPALLCWGGRTMKAMLRTFKSGRIPRRAARLASVTIRLRKS
jgi:Ca-activated chloride channel family protein